MKLKMTALRIEIGACDWLSARLAGWLAPIGWWGILHVAAVVVDTINVDLCHSHTYTAHTHAPPPLTQTGRPTDRRTNRHIDRDNNTRCGRTLGWRTWRMKVVTKHFDWWLKWANVLVRVGVCVGVRVNACACVRVGMLYSTTNRWRSHSYSQNGVHFTQVHRTHTHHPTTGCTTTVSSWFHNVSDMWLPPVLRPHPHPPHMPQLSSAVCVCVVIQLQVSALIRRCSCICYCCSSSCCCWCCCFCNCRLVFEMFRRLSLALLCGWFLVFWEQQKQNRIKNTRINWTVMGDPIPCRKNIK